MNDAMCPHYGWQPASLPDLCACGNHFSVKHSLSCPTGGFQPMRHNEIRDTIIMLDDVCHDEQKEPTLQHLTGVLPQRTNTSDDEARPDISMCGVGVVDFKRLP